MTDAVWKFKVVPKERFDDEAARLAIRQLQRKPASVVGLATGDTTNGMHRTLAEKIVQEKIDVSCVSVCNLDEAAGLPDDHPARGISRLKRMLYDPIALKPEQIVCFRGQPDDLEAECRAFEAALARRGGIDLQFVGIGLNGHIAFCEPGMPFHAGCCAVELNAGQREEMRRKFQYASLDDVPTRAMTMGIKSIMHASRVVLLAKGSHKAGIVRAALTGPVTPELPASVLQLHPRLTVLLDDEAAAGMAESK
ncbi:glucosamine-6-phosphate deaminase [Paenibacillus cymbidii]|uniref:glucosamine-6-phosphate deaminase n=1 Tax=Paenibacillus cymbidii TaxID=1639034 RepID=UPI001F3E7FFD|nr:glucosamine-6-phosphate deaminase [Paenibacillus cymbidii]